MICRMDFSHWLDLPWSDKAIGLENFDSIKLITCGDFSINATIFNTWIVIALITIVSWLTTRKIDNGRSISKLQIILETLVIWMQKEAKETSGSASQKYFAMALGLFCFIVTANLLTFIPWFRPPTASLSTTMALALVVFLAIPYFSIKNAGVKGYLRKFIEPVPLLLPMNIFSEIFSVFAMGLRLFGNMLSGVMFAGILSAFIPFVAPLTMQTLGLLTGSIQAYIFALLALVYTSSVRAENEQLST
ncbi:MAG: F0F1 ATP synthase subunit A [Alphaproteobacteria bacterium]|nr:F0F1 ATP synthase subunit A [Alphaproteobacteria bacterium]